MALQNLSSWPGTRTPAGHLQENPILGIIFCCSFFFLCNIQATFFLISINEICAVIISFAQNILSFRLPRWLTEEHLLNIIYAESMVLNTAAIKKSFTETFEILKGHTAQ